MNIEDKKKLFKQHYPELDFLRTIAITLVMLRHFIERLFANPDGVYIARSIFSMPEGTYFNALVYWGSNGVNLFFVLSGFLIGGQIIEELYNGDFSFKRFYIKRFWRIFPPYYFSLLVVLVVYLTVKRNDQPLALLLEHMVLHIFYLQGFIVSFLMSSIYWTLSIEEWFYIVIPMVLFISARYAKRFVPVGVIILLLSGVAGRFIYYFVLSQEPGVHYKWLPFHFDNLLMGVLAAYVFIRYQGRLSSLSGSARALIIIVSLIFLGITIKYSDDSFSYFSICWTLTFTGIGFSLLIIGTSIKSLGENFPLKRFFTLIAKLSYAMYLYHFFMVKPVGMLARKAAGFAEIIGPEMFVVLSFIFYFVVVVIVSGCFYLLIDRPSMRHRKRVLER